MSVESSQCPRHPLPAQSEHSPTIQAYRLHSRTAMARHDLIYAISHCAQAPVPSAPVPSCTHCETGRVMKFHVYVPLTHGGHTMGYPRILQSDLPRTARLRALRRTLGNRDLQWCGSAVGAQPGAGPTGLRYEHLGGASEQGGFDGRRRRNPLRSLPHCRSDAWRGK